MGTRSREQLEVFEFVTSSMMSAASTEEKEEKEPFGWEVDVVVSEEGEGQGESEGAWGQDTCNCL